MKVIQAKTVNDLLSRLEDLEEEGFDLHRLTWNGWDDESLIINNEEGESIITIEPKEDS